MTQATIRRVRAKDLDPILQSALRANQRIIEDMVVLGMARSGDVRAEIVTAADGTRSTRLICTINGTPAIDIVETADA